MILLSENWKFNVFSCLIVVFTLVYLFLKWNYSYWERHGFKTLPGYIYFIGHLKIPPRKTIAAIFEDMYKASDEPFVGIYTLLRPILLIRDPEVIRSILIKDFSHFPDRITEVNNDYDQIQSHLFTLPGHKWRNLRSKLTPAFTSGKLKSMFTTVVECGSKLQNYLEKLSDNGEMLDLRDLSARYSTNVIASCAFGIEVDTINNPNNDFRRYGKRFLEPNLRSMLAFIAPSVLQLLRIKLLNSEVEHFIMSIVQQNLEYREQNNVIRKDIFQLMIQLRNTGTVQLDDEWETVIRGDEEKKMSLIEIAAQTYIFFLAGFETSSTTLTFCLYELVKNQEIQERAQNEIDCVLKKHDGKLSYDSLLDMKYLEACIEETLRKYPVLGVLTRACVKNYQIPGTDKVIEKGTEIFIPIYALQNDEKYYETPGKFNPNRFNEDNLAEKNQGNRPYIPFGDGPRNCIGMRLGKMQVKVALVLMLQKFKFQLENELLQRELKFDPGSFLLTPLDRIQLNVFKR